jgi:hypothetical protein
MTQSEASPTAPSNPLVPDGARVVEWYRLDVGRRIRRALGPNAALLTVGSIVANYALGWSSGVWSTVGSAAGLCMIGGGGLGAILGLKRIFEEDDYLLVRTDGLLYHVGNEARLFPWDELSLVRWSSERQRLELLLAHEELVPLEHRFATIGGEALAERLEEVRRKAIWNLLPEQQR